MAEFINNVFTIEKNFNDFGARATPIGLAGRIEVTILDNLYRISQLLHGRILTSATILGGYRVYLERAQLRDLILSYQSILPYQLSTDLGPLINTLRNIYQSTTTDAEAPLDSRIILQMITVHNNVSLNLKNVWEGVIGLRLLSQSGSNKDITIDGKQQTLDTMLAKFSEPEMQQVRHRIEISGQLAGIKAPRQVEMRDMISDMIFSRKDSYVTLNQLFASMKKQRTSLRRFRTDILFCPVDRYRELEAGKNIKALLKHAEKESNTEITTVGFNYADYVLSNNGTTTMDIAVSGTISSGSVLLEPSQEIEIGGYGLKVSTADLKHLKIEAWADLRDYTQSGASIITRAIEGKLKDDSSLRNIYFQIIKPVIPYLTSVLRKLKNSEFLQLCINKMGEDFKTTVSTYKPSDIYYGLLTGASDSANQRLTCIYILTMIVPQLLLDPTLTFTDMTGTPPYVHEYNSFVQGLRKLYD